MKRVYFEMKARLNRPFHAPYFMLSFIKIWGIETSLGILKMQADSECGRQAFLKPNSLFAGEI